MLRCDYEIRYVSLRFWRILIVYLCVHIGGTLLLEKEYQTRYISDVSDVIIDIVVVQLPTLPTLPNLYFCCYKGEVRFQLFRGIITYRLRR